MTKCNTLIISTGLFLLTNVIFGQKKSETFEFEFKGEKLRGLIESPADR